MQICGQSDYLAIQANVAFRETMGGRFAIPLASKHEAC